MRGQFETRGSSSSAAFLQSITRPIFIPSFNLTAKQFYSGVNPSFWNPPSHQVEAPSQHPSSRPNIAIALNTSHLSLKSNPQRPKIPPTYLPSPAPTSRGFIL